MCTRWRVRGQDLITDADHQFTGRNRREIDLPGSRPAFPPEEYLGDPFFRRGIPADLNASVRVVFNPHPLRLRITNLLQFVEGQISILVGVELVESLGQGGHVAIDRVDDVLLKRD